MSKSATPSDFRALAERSAVGVWQISVSGHTVYLNPAMCAMLEIAGPDELDGVPYHRFFAPESRETVAREHRKRFAGETSQYEIEIVGSRGTRRQVLVSGAPLLAPDGRLEGYIGTFTDISQRKKVEEALRRSEAKYRTLVETAHDCIWACSPDGIVTFANRAWSRTLGLSEEEIVGRSFVEFLAPSEVDAGRRVFAHLLAGKSYRNHETTLIHRDGRAVVLSFNSTALRDDEGRIVAVMGTAQDVTERKAAEDLRTEFSRRLLAAIEEERYRIARELHDSIGQSLAALGLQVYALARANGKGPAEMRGELARVGATLREIAEATARLGCDYHPTEIADLGLATAIRSFGEKVSQLHGASFSFREEISLDAVRGERALHLYRIVQEALGNATKHGEATELRVRVEPRAKGARLSIEDNGSGFDLESSRMNRGLGLATMKERAEMLGGRLTVRSRRGEGTCVAVSFEF